MTSPIMNRTGNNGSHDLGSPAMLKHIMGYAVQVNPFDLSTEGLPPLSVHRIIDVFENADKKPTIAAIEEPSPELHFLSLDQKLSSDYNDIQDRYKLKASVLAIWEDFSKK